MLLEGYKLTVEIDTGAVVSIVNKDTVNNSPFIKCLPLQQTDVTLCTYARQPVKFYLDKQAKPQFLKVRLLPLGLCDKVAEELDRLQTRGIIIPMKFLKWSTPTVSIIKNDGSIRICGDFKRIINKSVRTKVYPLPWMDKLLTIVCLMHRPSPPQIHLILTFNYNLNKNHKNYVVTSKTHKVLYKYTCLPFVVASASAIFQWTMELLLQGLPMLCVYIDDILVPGKTLEEHLHNVNEADRGYS